MACVRECVRVCVCIRVLSCLGEYVRFALFFLNLVKNGPWAKQGKLQESLTLLFMTCVREIKGHGKHNLQRNRKKMCML